MTGYTSLELSAIEIVENFYKEIWTPEYTKNTVQQIKSRLASYQKDNGLKSFALGMSGGLDSAVIAALSAGLNTKAMFIGINSSEEHRRLAELVAKQYNIDYSEKFINAKDLELFKQVLLTDQNDRMAIGNLKARLRMIALYDLARANQGCVLSTDNLSELQMGFWTLHGDVGDIGPIQFFNKGFELQYVAKELNIPEDVIIQAPSDGLKVTEANTDEAQLGGNYRYVDTVMYAFFKSEMAQASRGSLNPVFKQLLETERAQNVIKRFRNSEFKRKDLSTEFIFNNPGRQENSDWEYFFGSST